MRSRRFGVGQPMRRLRVKLLGTFGLAHLDEIGDHVTCGEAHAHAWNLTERCIAAKYLVVGIVSADNQVPARAGCYVVQITATSLRPQRFRPRA